MSRKSLATGVSGTGLALDTCRAKNIGELAALRWCGFSCGTLYRLQTICSPERGLQALRGAAFAVSGDGPGVHPAGSFTYLFTVTIGTPNVFTISIGLTVSPAIIWLVNIRKLRTSAASC